MSDMSDLLRDRLAFFRKHALQIPNNSLDSSSRISSSNIKLCYDEHVFWMQGVFYPKQYDLYGETEEDFYTDPLAVPRGEEWRYSELVSKGEIINGVYELVSQVSSQYDSRNFQIQYGSKAEFVRLPNFTPNKKYILSVSLLGTPFERPNAYVHISRKGEKVGQVVIPHLYLGILKDTCVMVNPANLFTE